MAGLGEACRALSAPIVGGNVSLYNEGATGPIYPTPVIGMVGRLPDGGRAGRLGFVNAGDTLALVGPFAPSQVASELAKLRGQQLPDGLPEIYLEAAAEAFAAVRDAVRSGTLSSAHDVAEGGVAIALAESAMAGRLGAEVALGEGHWESLGPGGEVPDPGWPEGSAAAALFGEGSGGILVSGPESGLRALAARRRAGGG